MNDLSAGVGPADVEPPVAEGPGHVVVQVVGARPNFIKAAPVIRALGALGIRQRIVHTGQHYDPLLSDVFFRDLSLPSPDVSLGVGSGSQGHQTGALLVALEDEFVADRILASLRFEDAHRFHAFYNESVATGTVRQVSGEPGSPRQPCPLAHA